LPRSGASACGWPRTAARTSVIAVCYGIGVNIMLGAQCAALPELFGSRHRYIGVAVAR
jgi:hypothetical protein